MGLSLKKLKQQVREVSVQVPDETNPKGFRTARFNAELKMLSQDEFDSYQVQPLGDDATTEEKQAMNKEAKLKQRQMLDAVLIKIVDGIDIEDGVTADEVLEEVKKDMLLSQAILKAFMEMYTGRIKDNLKK